MEGVVSPARTAWSGRSVAVTGHTGFKGGWLSLWLNRLGADVHGLSLDPPTSPSLFEAAGVGRAAKTDARHDIRDAGAVKAFLEHVKPSVLFHLAAQPLVIEGYASPVETFEVNALAVAKLLEAARNVPGIEAIVIVTTDKVYDNKEWLFPYRETDALGGHDPYSASKAAAEIVTASFRSSFFGANGHAARIGTARAGNVIGGGDWAANRLIPDCLRAFDSGEDVQLRYPGATRPWQHVLDPVGGYIRLAEGLLGDGGADLATSWNFGPGPESDATVGEVAAKVCRHMGDESRYRLPENPADLHEAGNLRLDSSRSKSLLNWKPQWVLDEAIQRTVAWHRSWRSGEDMHRFSLSQIDDYVGQS